MRLRLFKVSGDSMSPSLMAGNFLLAIAQRRPRLNVGSVVVVEHPRYGRIIKRVSAIDDHGQLWLCGDNQQRSTSTSALGAITTDQVLARVICRLGSASKPTAPLKHQGDRTWLV